MVATTEIDNMMLLLQADQIYTPKALMHMGLHERTVLLISEVLTDNRFKSVGKVKEIIKELPKDYILAYAFDNKKVAKRIEKDLIKVLDNFEKVVGGE
ncbi:MAG: hypothetical protein IJ583_04960 [Firmicutes bacterium]|nr:hypothetical protein [Bacillota bacterium]